jgi:hypothetical protein
MRILSSVALLALVACTKGSPEQSAKLFRSFVVAGDVAGQRSLLTAEDGTVVDSSFHASRNRDSPLPEKPELDVAVDSARVVSISHDTALVVVIGTAPNLRGASDSEIINKVDDVDFLRTRPRRTTYDTVVAVKENRRWLVSVDARFLVGLSPLRRLAFDSDSSVSARAMGAQRIESYYKSNGRKLEPWQVRMFDAMREAALYQDSLTVSGRIIKNALFRSAPSTGSHLISGTLQNRGNRHVYEAQISATFPSGERKLLFVFNVPPGSSKAFYAYDLWENGPVRFVISTIQFERTG